jgi:hypothetical protein
VSRRNELLNLAERLDSASDDDNAWDVWATYTGLFSARHLSLSSPHPGHGSDALSFWATDPAPVEARLRRLGPHSGRGRPSRMYDRSAGKQAARQAAAEAARGETRTWEQLLALSGLPLSQWTGLRGTVSDHLTDFVMVLDAAIADLRRRAGHDPAPGTVVATQTGDGLWDLTATMPADGTPDAVVTLTEGRLVYPDLTVTVARAIDAPAFAGANPLDPSGGVSETGPASAPVSENRSSR